MYVVLEILTGDRSLCAIRYGGKWVIVWTNKKLLI